MKGTKILVVSKEEAVRFQVSEVICKRGYAITFSSNPDQAFDLISSGEIDVVVYDALLCKGNPMYLLRRIKLWNPMCPVTLLVLGFIDISTAKVFDLGVEAIIHKPIDDETLARSIDRLLLKMSDRWTADRDLLPADAALTYEVESLGNIDEDDSHVNIGRGGAFFVSRGAIPQADERVFFSLKFSTGPVKDLTGIGTVKWSRNFQEDGLSAGFGVEFSVLSNQSLAQVLHYLELAKPASYIPLARRKEVALTSSYEKRQHPRLKVLGGRIPGVLLLGDNNSVINGRAIDVSERGLGIVVESYLAPGTYLLLEVGRKTLRLEVVYCLLDLESMSTFRCGLLCREAKVDLTALFERELDDAV